MHNPSTHPSSPAVKFGNVLPTLLLFLLAGCAGPVPKSDAPPSHLLQLSDRDWVDLSDIREIQFKRNDLTVSPGTDPFSISLWRNGSDNAFVFAFEALPVLA